jgi:hypothetical protein
MRRRTRCVENAPTAMSENRTSNAMHSATGGKGSNLVTRYKCPGCDKTYAKTSGIINHLQDAKHPGVEGPISEEATRVSCLHIDGKYAVVSAPPTPARSTDTAQSWADVLGFKQSPSSISAAADGDWKNAAQPLLLIDEQSAPAAASGIWKLSKRWIPTVSALLSDINSKILHASVSEKELLSSDKLLVPVESAPTKYSSSVALLLEYLHAGTADDDISIASVTTCLTAILTDTNPECKRQSRIVLFFSAVLKGLPEFSDPNQFQILLTHIKHAFKGAALIQFQSNVSSAKLDAEFAAKYLTASACAFSDTQHWKRKARRCIHAVKEELIRWTADPGVVQVCTDKEAGTWRSVAFADLVQFVHTSVSEAKECMLQLQAKLFAPEDLEMIKDPANVSVGHGMMTHNNSVAVGDVILPLSAAEVLKICYHIGNLLGYGIVYSGAGAMRVPQLACILVLRINNDADRTLRLYKNQTAVRYSKIKQADLIPIEQQNKFKRVLKFQYEELSAAICSFVINCKPMQIKAAIELYGAGSAQVQAAASLLIVGPNCLPRSSRHELDSLARIVNDRMSR